jgi:hypothetical protein
MSILDYWLGQSRTARLRPTMHPAATSGGWRRPRVLLLAACLALAACGSPGLQPSESDGGAPPGTAPSGTAPSGGGGGTGGGSGGGPITVAMESGTYAYNVGRCEIIDGVVHVTALGQGMASALEATLPEWDRDMAYSQRYGRVSLTNIGSAAGDNFELVAGRNDQGTTWDWTVSGANVAVVARMGNRMTATRDEGVEEFTEYRDVTIDIQCSGGVFGSGPDAERFAEHEFGTIEDPMQRVPGRVTVELEGTKYEIAYLTTCQFFQDQISAEGTANEANVWLYSEGAGVNFDFAIGDRRDEFRAAGVERWALPAKIQHQDDFRFEGSDTSRTWSGPVVSEDGTEAVATITVECTEGDAFESAGSGSIVLDGVMHELDVVSTCSIQGTTVDFYGQSSASDVVIIVTGGGSQILLGDEAGQQSMTRDIVFDVAGQQATWTGTLAGDRQATVTIDCVQ